MGFKQLDWSITWRVLLLLLTLSTPAIVILNGWSEALVFILPLIVYQVVDLVRYVRKAQDELSQFIESVHYRDFSRYYNEQYPNARLQLLHKGFNEINSTLKSINKEKESQHLHLQKIMELVDTGILSYDVESGEVVLLNDSLKKLLHLPYMKTIHHLEKRDEELYRAVQELQPGRSRIATAYTSNFEKSTLKVLLSATAFRSEDRTYKLVAFQNVSEALDETESRAWQKLLNVLTHEIMNSVAPIASLADTLKTRLHETAATGPSAHDMEDFELSVSTIKNRSLGLLRFAEVYRNLNRITKLNVADVSVQEVFTNLEHLMHPTLAQKNISLEIMLDDPAIRLQADKNLLDQVLINLLVNAIEAVKNEPVPAIVLSAYTSGENTFVKMEDNGIGMAREVQEKIFIPFFSTRKNGTGIGLSLCKQILMLHQGSIQVQSAEGVGTAFLLRFPRNR
ncbi:histidine kinase/DNA gyrase B/HSP90-like ATPase [Pontibacter mucosus]|uniref:histidine kinase n=1 Tax=Pontibacter mucosus TaxID=1649266 RepID=A0A2T5YQB2_9BACT|nr:HAMP domain-containing sensor histidine kinase [Pontibacter mucosus]PTX21497.1 histidine kinase/DNA gyrase B/HSP90-like ATPase [Pontibacter mucosus]